jgi:hypothetical protein
MAESYSTRWKDDKCIQNFCWKNIGLRILGRPRHRWEDNIKINFRGIDWENIGY